MEIDPSEYAAFYANYISYASEDTAHDALSNRTKELIALLHAYKSDEEAANYAYAEGKWSIKQLVLHLIDSEMNFVIRTLWALRGESSDLPGFDHNKWVEENPDENITMEATLAWFENQSASTLALFQTVNENQWDNRVTANGVTFTVRSLAAIICGHTRHHAKIISERYIPHL